MRQALIEALVANGPRLRRRGARAVRRAVDAGLRAARQPLARGDGGRRARRGGALQEGARWTSCCGSRRSPASRRGRRRAGIAAPGRPGWHIECSAMAEKHSGRDLRHPRRRHRPRLPAPRERDRAEPLRARHAGDGQRAGCTTASCRSRARRCAKSLGNFVTIHELLATSEFGGQPWHGRVLRLAMLGDALPPADRLDGRQAGAGARARSMEFARAGCTMRADGASRMRRRARGAVRTISTRRAPLSIIHGVAQVERRAMARSRPPQLKATLAVPGPATSSTSALEDFDVGSQPRASMSTRARSTRSDRCPQRRPQGQGLQGGRSHPRRARRHGHPAQGRQGPRHRRDRDDVGGEAMSRANARRSRRRPEPRDVRGWAGRILARGRDDVHVADWEGHDNRSQRVGPAVPGGTAYYYMALKIAVLVAGRRGTRCGPARVLVRRTMTRERLYLFDTTLRDGAQTTGVDFSLEDKRLIAAHARRARHRLHRGRLSRRQRHRHRVLQRRSRASRTPRFTAFGMTKRAGRSVVQRSGLPGDAAGQGRRHLPRRQGLGLSRARGARHHQRGEPRGRRAVGRGGACKARAARR